MADGGHVCRRTRILFGTCTLGTEGNLLTKLQQNPTSGPGRDVITIYVYRRTVGRTGGRTFLDSKKSSSGLRPEELMISKRALKRALKFR